jgi:hypothetical protein
MTASTEQERSEWSDPTNRLTADHAGHGITIEVLDAEGGDAELVERLPFDSITYDHKDDVIVVSVGGRAPRHPAVLRHVIHHPQEVLFDLIGQGAALKITDVSGTTTLVSLLRRPEHERRPGRLSRPVPEAEFGHRGRPRGESTR